MEETKMETSEVINRPEFPMSVEFGKPGLRHKIYYKDSKDLSNKLAMAFTAEGMILKKQGETK